MAKEAPTGICKLCKETRELRYSHVVPEFFYRKLYDDKSRGLVIKEAVKREWIQKGYREYLLCSECEGKLNVYETYVARKWKDFPKLIGGAWYTLRELDYTKFKLLILSILWRASVAQDSFFNAVRLGPHEEKIRLMILNNDPGNSETYAFVPVIEYWDNIIVPTVESPSQFKKDAFTMYRLTFGGVAWHYLVSSKPASYFGAHPFFSSDGVLFFATGDIRNSPMIKAIMTQVGNFNRL
jgi:hypothetical protein